MFRYASSDSLGSSLHRAESIDLDDFGIPVDKSETFNAELSRDPDAVLHVCGLEHLATATAAAARHAVSGNESQVVTITVPPGEVVRGTPGTMMFLSPNVTQRPSRCFRELEFRYHGNGLRGYAALAPRDPFGKIVPIDLSEVSGSLLVQRGAYMASYGEVQVDLGFDCHPLLFCCGSSGRRHQIRGEGTVLLCTTGSTIQKMLKDDETIIIDTECILAFSDSCRISTKQNEGLLEGKGRVVNSTLSGPGLVIIQSTSKNLFLKALATQKIQR